jgi:polysaccharide export outer membrane protein
MILILFRWVFQRTLALVAGASQPTFRRAVLVASACLPVVALGCASGPRGSDQAAGWYQREDLPQFVAETSGPAHDVLEPEYVIGVGDKLDIVFLFQTNLSTRGLVVRRDGRISLPYVGDQMAAGITPMTLDSLLTTRFSEILREPNLAVIVTEPAPQKVFVLGEVKQPGAFTFDDEVTMLQAVAMAGGFVPGGLANHAVLIRREGFNRIVGIEVDLAAVMDGASLANDIRLRNYDIVMIPQHPIYSAADFMNAVYDVVNAPLDLVFKGWQIANLSASYEYFRTTGRP